MPSLDKRVDDYIDNAESFAVPILLHLRHLLHSTCPEVVETIKWGFPNFEYHGAIMCHMAAFKKHCAFGFWKAALMKDPKKLFDKTSEAMGHLGQIRSPDDLPADKILIAYIQEAMKLNEEGQKVVRSKAGKDTPPLETPEGFRKALAANKPAQKVFESFSPSNKKDYITWIAEAKTEATRNKRIDTAVEWIAEGKTRHWKYK